MGTQPDSFISDQEDLIDLAYSMAIEPQRYRDLFSSLEKYLHTLEQNRSSPELMENLSAHFNRAGDMIDRQSRRFHYATGSRRYVDEDIRPSALISPQGILIHCNTSSLQNFGFTNGETLSADCFEHGHFDRLKKDLEALDSYKTDEVISVYTAYFKHDDTPIKLALSKTVDFYGKTIGRLCTFHMKWIPQIQQEFQSSFNLTPVEIEITRAIISGQSLNDLARQRGRSVATLRNQLKSLLAKMNLRSQIELACVYSGFAQFTLTEPITDKSKTRKKSSNSTNSGQHFTLGDGRTLHYEVHGPKTGRPVLYFHALVGGSMLTQDMQTHLKSRNIKLIPIWRPYFADSSAYKCAVKDAPQFFAKDVEALLSHLNIQSCQILGHGSGAIYAYACAQFMGSKTISIVNVAGAIPLVSKHQFSLMSQKARNGLKFARFAPSLLPIGVRSMMNRIDAGFGEEFSLDYYSTNAPDLLVVQKMEFKTHMRQIYPIVSRQGQAHMSRDMILQATKWGDILQDITCPVTLVHGETDTSYVASTVESFASSYENFSYVPIANAGQLAFYQAPSIVFQALDEQWAKVTGITHTI